MNIGQMIRQFLRNHLLLIGTGHWEARAHTGYREIGGVDMRRYVVGVTITCDLAHRRRDSLSR